jgi:hypothetical protein
MVIRAVLYTAQNPSVKEKVSSVKGLRPTISPYPHLEIPAKSQRQTSDFQSQILTLDASVYNTVGLGVELVKTS